MNGLPISRRTLLVSGGALALAGSLPALAQGRRVQAWRHYAPCRFGQLHFHAAEPDTDDEFPTLVCLHSSPGSGLEFLRFQAVMANERRVLCPDTAGYGASDGPLEQPDIADYAGALADALASLGYGGNGSGPVDVLGFHTGTLIALELANQRPDLVRALVLPSVPLFPQKDRPGLLSKWAQPRPFLEDPDYVGRRYREVVIDADDGLDPERRHALFTAQLRSGMRSHFGIDAVFRYDVERALERLSQPVLFPVLDETLGPNTRQAARLPASATLAERSDLGGPVWDLQPERMSRLVGNYLDGLPRVKTRIPAPVVKPIAQQADGVRRWRHYAANRYGLMHFRSGAPQTTDKAPLVLLHQSPLSGFIFEELIAELSRDRIVHAADTPGFGDSDGPRRQPGMRDYGAATLEALRQLGSRRVDLFGFHTGAFVAAEVARQAPDLIRRLVLCGVPYYAENERLDWQRQFLKPYAFWTDPDYVDTLYKRIVIDGDQQVSAERRLQRFTDRLRAGPRGEWGPRAVFAYDADTALASIKTPTLLLAFEEVMTQPTRDARQLLPHAEFRHLEQLGMMGFMTQPDVVAAALRDYLDGNR